jgi:hypothetical protein
MTKIGIFWVYKNTVIGKARELSESQETVPGMLDSPDSHVDVWEDDATIAARFPELRDVEYQDVPRGRVVYATADDQAIVYMDARLQSAKIRRAIANFFDLADAATTWESDTHYTTDPNRIREMFDDA